MPSAPVRMVVVAMMRMPTAANGSSGAAAYRSTAACDNASPPCNHSTRCDSAAPHGCAADCGPVRTHSASCGAADNSRSIGCGNSSGSTHFGLRVAAWSGHLHSTSSLTGDVIAEVYGDRYRMVRHDHRCAEEGHQHG